MKVPAEDVDVLVVGAGPAGASTALGLVGRDPVWAKRIVVVDRATFPRDKLCGGAVTHLGEKVLGRMGLTFVPEHVAVREVRVVHGARSCSFFGDPVLRVTRRATFDAWLLDEVRARGVGVREDTVVRAIVPGGARVRVETDRGAFSARMVVGADGSRSTVRRLLGLRDAAHVARLLEVLTGDARGAPPFEEGVAVFEFGDVGRGLAGYYWDFPSVEGGVFKMNRGVFEAPGPRDGAVPLRTSLATKLDARGVSLADLELKGHPILTFDPTGVVAVPRILLAGDAAGADPLLGEGISFALAYGEVAADAIVDAFARDRFDLGDYRRRILDHPLLGQLPARVTLSRLLGHAAWPFVHDALFRVGRRLVAGSRWHDRSFVPARAEHRILRA